MTKSEERAKAAHDKEDKKGGRLKFLWNSEDKSFLGRTGCSWEGELMGCMYEVVVGSQWQPRNCTTIPPEKSIVPKYYGMDSQTLNNPGLSYRPMVNVDSSLIKFHQGEVASFDAYVNQLDSFLHEYRTSHANAIDCSKLGPNDTVPENKVCSFNVDVVNCSRNNAFGFRDGKPCVVLKMNRLYGFKPEPYEDMAQLEEDQGFAPGHKPRFFAFKGGNVGIGCDGENEVDKENLDSVTFYPDAGLNPHFYPYLNQQNYTAPFVFMQVTGATKRVAIMIECKLYAKNIANPGGNEMHGSTSFVLVID